MRDDGVEQPADRERDQDLHRPVGIVLRRAGSPAKLTRIKAASAAASLFMTLVPAVYLRGDSCR